MNYIRIITKSDCDKCKSMKKHMESQGATFFKYGEEKPQGFAIEILEDSDETSKMLDSWNIYDLPVVQIVNNEKIEIQFLPGSYTLKAIKDRANKLGIELNIKP